MLFKRLNNKDKTNKPSPHCHFFPLFTIFLGLTFSTIMGCRKRDRLSTSIPSLFISPTVVEIEKNQTQVLTARGVGDVAPTWALSDSSLGMLNTTFGPSVIVTGTGLGDIVVSATFQGDVAYSTIAVVAYKPDTSNANVFDVYSDNGLPSGSDVSSDIFTRCGASFGLQEISTGYTPEGNKYQRASNMVSTDFWGVTLDKPTSPAIGCAPVATPGRNKDLSGFSSGSLRFALRLARTMGSSERALVELTDTSDGKALVTLGASHGFSRDTLNWQEIRIPLSEFSSTFNRSKVKVPFAILVQGLSESLGFDADAIRWVK